METRLLLLLLLFVRTLKWAGQVLPSFPPHFDRYNEIPPSLDLFRSRITQQREEER